MKFFFNYLKEAEECYPQIVYGTKWTDKITEEKIGILVKFFFDSPLLREYKLYFKSEYSDVDQLYNYYWIIIWILDKLIEDKIPFPSLYKRKKNNIQASIDLNSTYLEKKNILSIHNIYIINLLLDVKRNNLIYIYPSLYLQLIKLVIKNDYNLLTLDQMFKLYNNRIYDLHLENNKLPAELKRKLQITYEHVTEVLHSILTN